MGNVIGRQEQAPQWEPNIPGPRDMQQQNNPNLPFHEQMRSMILQYAVPMLCLSAIGELIKGLIRNTKETKKKKGRTSNSSPIDRQHER